MKINFSMKDDAGRRTLFFLRAFFRKPNAGLDTLAKLAALEVASQQARIELADAERAAEEEGGGAAVVYSEPAAVPNFEAARKQAAEIMFDALNEISRAEVFFDDGKRLKRIATAAVVKVERIVRENKQQ